LDLETDLPEYLTTVYFYSIFLDIKLDIKLDFWI